MAKKKPTKRVKSISKQLEKEQNAAAKSIMSNPKQDKKDAKKFISLRKSKSKKKK